MDKNNADKALFEFAEIADCLGTRWCLLLGTCLGMYRDGGYIEWDNDIDLGVIAPAEGLKELFTRLADQGFERGRTYLNPGNEANQHFRKNRVLLDIFFKFTDRQKRFLTSFDRVIYTGKSFNIPHPVEEYLAFEFGDWRTPRDGKSRGPGKLIEIGEILAELSEEHDA